MDERRNKSYSFGSNFFFFLSSILLLLFASPFRHISFHFECFVWNKTNPRASYFVLFSYRMDIGHIESDEREEKKTNKHIGESRTSITPKTKPIFICTIRECNNNREMYNVYSLCTCNVYICIDIDRCVDDFGCDLIWNPFFSRGVNALSIKWNNVAESNRTEPET